MSAAESILCKDALYLPVTLINFIYTTNAFASVLIFVEIPPVKSLHIHILLIVEKLCVFLLCPFTQITGKGTNLTHLKSKIILNMLFWAYNLIIKRITRSLYSLYKFLIILFGKKLFLLRKEIGFVHFIVLYSPSIGTIRF